MRADLQAYLGAMQIELWQPRPKLQVRTLSDFAACYQAPRLLLCTPAAAVELAPIGQEQHAGADPYANDCGQLLQAMLHACKWREIVLLDDCAQAQLAIKTLAPKLVLLLGLGAARLLQADANNIKDLRGKVHNISDSKCLVSYHPQAALYEPRFKRPLWQDLQLAMTL